MWARRGWADLIKNRNADWWSATAGEAFLCTRSFFAENGLLLVILQVGSRK
jgi:hypothetical protein